MMRISDEITAYILHIMEQAENGAAELQRNVLAEELGCVPSQITYVLSSRFTPAQGYVVESRRGGGGYIRIRRVVPQERMTPLISNYRGISCPFTGPQAKGTEWKDMVPNAVYEYIRENNLTDKVIRLLRK